MRDWRISTVDRVARALVWTARFVKGWLPRTLGGASALLLILWGALTDDPWNLPGSLLLYTGVAVALLAFGAEVIVQRPSYMALSKLREDAEASARGKSEALERALRILLARLGAYCGLNGHSDRLSVYYFHDGEFVMVARYAKNPTFAKPGRGRYKSDQGAIGRTWAEPSGQALVTMPTSKDRWRRSVKNQGFSDPEIDGLSMRSFCIGGHRLEAENTSVGVLVVESTTVQRVDQTHLDTIAASHIVVAIAELVAAFALMTPAGESITSAELPKRAGAWQSVPPRSNATSK